MKAAAFGTSGRGILAAGRWAVVVLVAWFALTGTAAVAATAAEAGTGKKRNPLFDEDRIHHLAVFTLVQPPGGHGRPNPVLITLGVKGPEALGRFCEFRPRVNEAVLSVLLSGQGGDGRAPLADAQRPLLQAVNTVLPGRPVRRVETRTARDPAAFGPALLQTDRVCEAVDK